MALRPKSVPGQNPIGKTPRAKKAVTDVMKRDYMYKQCCTNKIYEFF